MSDDALTYDEQAAPLSAEVIDLDGSRIRFGRGKGLMPCPHKNILYSTRDRRIWCEDCESNLDGFDAFMSLVDRFSRMERAARQKLADANEAMKKTIRRRAAQALSKAWDGRMVPCCPHCQRGLLPDDFANGAAAKVSKEFEVARRKREAAE